VLEARRAVKDGIGAFGADREDDGIGHGEPPELIATGIGLALRCGPGTRDGGPAVRSDLGAAVGVADPG